MGVFFMGSNMYKCY